MKRIQMCKKVNRNNNTIFNHISRKPPRINTITPEILVGQIWLQDEEPTKSVEIVELHSSDETDTSPQKIKHAANVQVSREVIIENTDKPVCVPKDEDLSHAWCYVSDLDHQVGHKYKVNKKSREKRRSNFVNHRVPTNSLTNIDQYGNDNFSNIYDNISSNPGDEKTTLNHQMNYYTILNKHLINSDTSSDSDCADVEIMATGDIVTETSDDWNHNGSYDEEIITYDPNPEKETRTIWIYSFKNKHLLTENDMEINTSAKNTTSCSNSCSFDSDDDKTKNKSTSTGVSRVCSPIPTIPRLNLSLDPALSTVTEVTESNKPTSSNETKGSAKDEIQKPKNSWILQDINLGTERSHTICHRLEKSTNIVNWMALSPREKRRRFNDSGDKWKGTILHLGESCQSERIVKDNSHNESALVETVEVQVDVHVTDKSPTQRSVGTSKSAGATTKPASNYIDQIVKDSDLDAPYCVQDHGDHEIKCGRKPQILVSNKFMINAANITDPIEKLDSCNWIYEERVEKETATYDYVSDCVEVDSIIYENDELNVTWVKNTIGLMKPALWNEYLPITDTPLSLHLSLSSIVENKRPSWLKRLAKCIICCK